MRALSVTLIMCLILESCSFRLTDLARSPSSDLKFDDLKVKYGLYKIKINGTEKDKNCKKEDIDRDFNRLMNSLKKDSCSESNFKLDKEEFVQRTCPKEKTEGAIDRVARKIIQEEKDKKTTNQFQNNLDKEFLGLFSEAQVYLRGLNNISLNDGIDENIRIDIINAYVENVLLPFRDLIVIKRSYQNKENDGSNYIKLLEPIVTDSLVKGLSTEQLGMLTQGPNPTATPFYMELIQNKNTDTYTLSFSPSDIIRRDVIALLKAPTSKNYVLALKWMTLHMMLSQIYVYDTILGNKAPLSIPNSCQNHFNGSLPATFNFKFEDGAGDQFLENILASHGLSFKQDDSSYLDYYIDNVSKDPTKDGYSGLIPFENYKNAKWGLSNKSYGALEAQFDDIAHFQSVLNVKLGDAYANFRDTAKDKSSKTKEKYNITYSGYDTFQQILSSYQPDEIAEIKLRDGTLKQIYPGKQNLSVYLLELMKKNGVEDFSQLITPKLKNKFLNKKVSLDFPSMYSSPAWRDWSLKTLADFVHQYRDLPTNSQLHRILNMNCSMMGSYSLDNQKGGLSDICKKGNTLQYLDDFLSEFRTGETYIPTRRLEERKFQSVYPLLTQFWQQVRDTTELLGESKPYELNFLLEQMAAGNPWARLKLSYMIALDQLEYQKEGLSPVYEFNGLWYSMDQKSKCDSNLLDTQYTKLRDAGKTIGLERTLTYNFAGKFLSAKEKEYVWRGIVDDFEQRNAQLFSVQRNNKTYYSSAEAVSYKTLLNTNDALATGVNISKKAQTEIGEVGKTTEAQVGDFFQRLYKLKGQPDKQQDLFDKFSKVNGVDNSFNLKLNFLAVDEAYKKPIYKDLLRQASLTRKLQIIDQLYSFCAMDVNDPKEFKNLFYSTTKAQNELNQLAGLPTIPENVMKKISEMSPEESRDMWWGIGSGVLGIAAIVVGGACTAVSGGICAPLGGAMAVAGLASLGIQVKLTSNELHRKLEADESEVKVKKMEDLGFANLGSHDEVHRSIAWTAVEAISIFPLIGIASKSAALGPKLVVASTRSIMRQTGKTAFKAAAKTVAEEEEVRMAKYVLGVESVTKNLGLDGKIIENATKDISKIKNLFQLGEIDFETMLKQMAKVLDPIKKMKKALSKTMKAEFGSVVVKETQAQIDQQTAKVVTQYFGDNSKSMLRVINSYSGERLNRAVRVMAEMNNPKRIGNRIPIYRGVRNWFLRMRNESLAKNAGKILRIEKELAALPNKPGALNSFIVKNVDDLTDIFLDIPLRKREIPYVIQIQGMPMMNLFGGRKIPLLSLMSEGQTLKKVFQSRARLVYETYKVSARSSLKLTKFVKAETTFGIFKAFQYSVAEMASRKTAEEGGKVITQYEQLELQMAKKLFQQYSEKGNKMEFAAFQKLVFNPANLKEKAIAEVIWESMPADELLNMKEVNEIAHKAVQELSQYSDIDSFERYLSALKVLTINRNPAVLEIM